MLVINLLTFFSLFFLFTTAQSWFVFSKAGDTRLAGRAQRRPEKREWARRPRVRV